MLYFYPSSETFVLKCVESMIEFNNQPPVSPELRTNTKKQGIHYANKLTPAFFPTF